LKNQHLILQKEAEGKMTAYTYEQWNTLDDQERSDLASRLTEANPDFRYVGLTPIRWNGQSLSIPSFAAYDESYVFLPEYNGPLGYDAPTFDSLFSPSIRTNWEQNVSYRSLDTHLATYLTPYRTVHLAPLFLQAEPTLYVNFEEAPDGHRHMALVNRAEIFAQLTARGDRWRLPSSDEWEYACCGGERIFFAWGNDWPPIPWSPKERRPDDAWHEDLQPNRWGLTMTTDPWALEYCADDVMRGGDGGSAASSDAGYVAEWISLACSFLLPVDHRMVNLRREGYLRRAYTACLPDL
jgi:Sulfatase-modifying factor enzyme 1